MFKQNSIFKKVLFNNLLIMIIPLTLILSVICYLMCINYKNKEIQIRYNYVNQYASDVNSEIGKILQMSEYVLKNTTIINGLDENFTNSYDKLKFLMYVKTYMDNMTNNTTSAAIIYSPNLTIFEDTYIQKIENLKQYDSLQEEFRQNKINIIWDNTILTDDNGRKYLTFFRNFPMNKACILSCRVYLPNLPSYSKNIFVAQDTSDLDQNTYIFTNVSDICTIALKLDLKTIHKRYLTYIFVFIGLDLFLFFVISIVARIVTDKITYRIDDFISQLSRKDILESDMKLLLSSEDVEELKVIKNTINSLVMKVKEISRSYYETELEKRRVELNLLQSKLGSHILYNSLSVIKLAAHERNDLNTTLIISNLVSYYRFMLNYGKEMIEIEQELEMTKKYVTIYEMSHRKKYELNIDVSDEINKCQILHLILQPFIENSIIHGLSGRRKDCKIHISGILKDDYIVLTIKDNGYGMSPEKLETLNNLQNYNERYGIKNSYQRLKLIYGNDSEVSFESQLDVGTTVTIKFKKGPTLTHNTKMLSDSG